jgi:hypothetical protein
MSNKNLTAEHGMLHLEQSLWEVESSWRELRNTLEGYIDSRIPIGCVDIAYSMHVATAVEFAELYIQQNISAKKTFSPLLSVLHSARNTLDDSPGESIPERPSTGDRDATAYVRYAQRHSHKGRQMVLEEIICQDIQSDIDMLLRHKNTYYPPLSESRLATTAKSIGSILLTSGIAYSAYHYFT